MLSDQRPSHIQFIDLGSFRCFCVLLRKSCRQRHIAFVPKGLQPFRSEQLYSHGEVAYPYSYHP